MGAVHSRVRAWKMARTRRVEEGRRQKSKLERKEEMRIFMQEVYGIDECTWKKMNELMASDNTKSGKTLAKKFCSAADDDLIDEEHFISDAQELRAKYYQKTVLVPLIMDAFRVQVPKASLQAASNSANSTRNTQDKNSTQQKRRRSFPLNLLGKHKAKASKSSKVGSLPTTSTLSASSADINTAAHFEDMESIVNLPFKEAGILDMIASYLPAPPPIVLPSKAKFYAESKKKSDCPSPPSHCTSVSVSPSSPQSASPRKIKKSSFLPKFLRKSSVSSSSSNNTSHKTPTAFDLDRAHMPRILVAGLSHTGRSTLCKQIERQIGLINQKKEEKQEKTNKESEIEEDNIFVQIPILQKKGKRTESVKDKRMNDAEEKNAVILPAGMPDSTQIKQPPQQLPSSNLSLEPAPSSSGNYNNYGSYSSSYDEEFLLESLSAEERDIYHCCLLLQVVECVYVITHKFATRHALPLDAQFIRSVHTMYQRVNDDLCLSAKLRVAHRRLSKALPVPQAPPPPEIPESWKAALRQREQEEKLRAEREKEDRDVRDSVDGPRNWIFQLRKIWRNELWRQQWKAALERSIWQGNIQTHQEYLFEQLPRIVFCPVSASPATPLEEEHRLMSPYFSFSSSFRPLISDLLFVPLRSSSSLLSPSYLTASVPATMGTQPTGILAQSKFLCKLCAASAFETQIVLDEVPIRLYDFSLRRARFRWITAMENAALIFFCASLLDFDIKSLDDVEEDNTRMSESLIAFEELVRSKSLKDRTIILCLTHADKLQEKVAEIGLESMKNNWPEFEEYAKMRKEKNLQQSTASGNSFDSSGDYSANGKRLLKKKYDSAAWKNRLNAMNLAHIPGVQQHFCAQPLGLSVSNCNTSAIGGLDEEKKHSNAFAASCMPPTVVDNVDSKSAFDFESKSTLSVSTPIIQASSSNSLSTGPSTPSSPLSPSFRVRSGRRNLAEEVDSVIGFIQRRYEYCVEVSGVRDRKVKSIILSTWAGDEVKKAIDMTKNDLFAYNIRHQEEFY